MITVLRTAARMGSLGFVILISAADYCINAFLRRDDEQGRFHAAWLQRSSRKFLRALNIHVKSSGMPPRRGIMVSNHLGYLDIVVFGSLAPMVFVSKKEVRDWPVFGWLSRCAGTLFVDRSRRSDAKRVADEMARILNNGVVVALFPEGTSSDGSSILPFRSPLLEPAASRGWPVTPACVSYQVTDGSPETDVCYWGDMDFLSHLLNLLSKRAVHATVMFGSPMESDSNRKELASNLRTAVVLLKQSPPVSVKDLKVENTAGEAVKDLARQPH